MEKRNEKRWDVTEMERQSNWELRIEERGAAEQQAGSREDDSGEV